MLLLQGIGCSSALVEMGQAFGTASFGRPEVQDVPESYEQPSSWIAPFSNRRAATRDVLRRASRADPGACDSPGASWPLARRSIVTAGPKVCVSGAGP